MKRIITITRCTQHFVDILTDEETEAEARTKALAEAGTDHRFWDIEQEETPWVLGVRGETEGPRCRGCSMTERSLDANGWCGACRYWREHGVSRD